MVSILLLLQVASPFGEVELTNFAKVVPTADHVIWFAETARCTNSSGYDFTWIDWYEADRIVDEGYELWGAQMWLDPAEDWSTAIVYERGQTPLYLEDTIKHELIHVLHPFASEEVYKHCTPDLGHEGWEEGH